jgi:hypothetical protein
MTKEDLNITAGDNIGRVMLERWLNEPLNDSGPHAMYRSEEHDLRNTRSQNSSDSCRNNGAVSVSEGEPSCDEGTGDISVMLSRWLDEPRNDGPYLVYQGEEYPVGDSSSSSEAAVERG